MAQTAKIIDVTKSYLPVDPQAFAENLSYTAQEDTPEKGMPIIAYEGYNFLPTSYGYRSYFGIDTEMTLDALPKPCDKVIVFQSKTYENMIIAFCSDGIRTARAGSSAWTLAVALTDEWTATQTYKEYTYCIIENNLYIYRQGHTHVIKVDDTLTITTFVPTFLNMAGQMGIFRANGRLAFWDSENSVSWSSAFDLTDFEPSIEDMVGNTIFFAVLGRIVTILPHGEGFVIYATKSIVGVSYANTSTALWDASAITSKMGIAYAGAVTLGTTNKEHFVYTSAGIMKIGHYNALSRQYEQEPILPELYDYLKESRDPVYIECHASRYLHFLVVDDSYISGRTSFTDVIVPSLKAPSITLDDSLWTSLDTNNDIGPWTGYQVLMSYLRNPTGTLITDEDSGTFDQPYWVAVCDNNLHPSISQLVDYFTLVAKKVGATQFYNTTNASMSPYVNNFTKNDFSFLFFNWNPSEDSQFNLVDFSESFILPKSYNKTVVENLVATADNKSSEDAANFNVATLLYNQYASSKQLDADKLVDYANDIIAYLASNPSYTYKVKSLDPFVNTDISMDTFHPSKVYWPKPESVTNILTIKQSPGVGLHQVCIERQYSHYYKFDLSNSYRTFTTPEVTYANQDTELVKTYVTRLTYNTHTFPVDLVTNHIPTLAELQAHFEANTFIDPTYGEMTPNFTDALDTTYSSDMNDDGFGLYTDYIETTLKVTVHNDIYTFHSVGTATIHLTYTNAASDPTSNYVSIGEHFRYSFTPDYVLSDITYPFALVHTIDSRYMSAEHVLFRLKRMFRAIVGSIDTIGGYNVSVDETTLAAEYSADTGEIYIRATCIEFGPIVHPNQVIFVLSTPYYYTFDVTDHIVSTASSVTATEVADARFLTDFSSNITLTHTKTEHYVDNILSSTTTHFTPETDWGKYWGYIPALPTAGSILANENDIGHLYKVSNCCIWYVINYDTTPDTYYQFAEFMYHDTGKMLNIDMPLGVINPVSQLPSCIDIGYELPGNDGNGWYSVTPSKFEYPGTTYTLQDGVPVPAYPTYVGSITFDLQLKKWGKQKNIFKALVELAPLNAVQNAQIPYTNFGMESGVVKSTGKIGVFSSKPGNTFMRYGKIGLYRLGFTEALEIILHFRTNSTGSVVVDGSIDGRDLETAIQHTESFTNVRQHTVKCHVNAMWHTISLYGNFDLQFMEFRGIIGGRR